MNPISLEQLTVIEATPLELISIASTLKCQHVSFFLRKTGRKTEFNPIVTDPQVRKEIVRRLDDTGVSPHTLEFFNLAPGEEIEPYRAALECGAELGGKRVATIVSDPDEQRVLDNFCRFCALAAEYGLGVNTEFVAITQLRSLAAAVALLSRANQPNAGITVDSLHLIRSGGSVAELARVDGRLIGHVQICDGPLTMPAERQLHEALKERAIPGEGEFPLRDFVNALPLDVPIGVEVPLQSLIDQGVGPLERARLVVEAARRIVDSRAPTRTTS
jgi:sugar phosphate isomerase/epimerase